MKSLSLLVGWFRCASLLGAFCCFQQPAGQWRDYGAELASSKYSKLDQIEAGNFQNLQIAWRWRSPEEDVRQRDASIWTRAFESTPLMMGGLLYTSTSLRNVAHSAIPGCAHQLGIGPGRQGPSPPHQRGRTPPPWRF